MSQLREMDQKVIDQAVRNAHQLRAEEFHKLMRSAWRGVKAFAVAVGEGFSAGRKAHDIS